MRNNKCKKIFDYISMFNMHYTHIETLTLIFHFHVNLSLSFSFSKFQIFNWIKSSVKIIHGYNYSGMAKIYSKSEGAIEFTMGWVGGGHCAEAATEPVCFGSMRIFLKVCPGSERRDESIVASTLPLLPPSSQSGTKGFTAVGFVCFAHVTTDNEK